MKARKSYAVYWKHKCYGEEWLRSCEWAENIETAQQELNRIRKNSRCAEAEIVERTESFKKVGGKDYD